MDLKTVLQSSKFLYSTIISKDEKLNLITTTYANKIVYVINNFFIDGNPVSNNVSEKEHIDALQALVGSKYIGYYRIVDSEENKEYIDYIKSLTTQENLLIKHMYLANVENLLRTATLELDGLFRVVHTNIYPKITHQTIKNPADFSFTLEGYINSFNLNLG